MRGRCAIHLAAISLQRHRFPCRLLQGGGQGETPPSGDSFSKTRRSASTVHSPISSGGFLMGGKRTRDAMPACGVPSCARATLIRWCQLSCVQTPISRRHLRGPAPELGLRSSHSPGRGSPILGRAQGTSSRHRLRNAALVCPPQLAPARSHLTVSCPSEERN